LGRSTELETEHCRCWPIPTAGTSCAILHPCVS
jgi:hypothetical protein